MTETTQSRRNPRVAEAKDRRVPEILLAVDSYMRERGHPCPDPMVSATPPSLTTAGCTGSSFCC